MDRVRVLSQKKRLLLLAVGILEACAVVLVTDFVRFAILYFAEEDGVTAHDRYQVRIVSAVGIGSTVAVVLCTWWMWRGSRIAAAVLLTILALVCSGLGVLYVMTQSPPQPPGARFWLVVVLILILVAAIRAMVAIERDSRKRKP